MKKTLLAALISLSALAGCASLDGAYVKADRTTYNAVAPVLDQAALDHPEYQPDLGNARKSWEIRLTEAEKSLKHPAK
jgi:hypothetical protein